MCFEFSLTNFLLSAGLRRAQLCVPSISANPAIQFQAAAPCSAQSATLPKLPLPPGRREQPRGPYRRANATRSSVKPLGPVTSSNDPFVTLYA